MNIHEHQAKEILRKFGAPVPNGVPVFHLNELQDAAKRLIKNKISSNDSTVIDSSNAERCAVGLVKAKEKTKASDSANAVFLAVETGISCGWTAAVAIEQCELVRLRNTPAAREKLDAFLSKG